MTRLVRRSGTRTDFLLACGLSGVLIVSYTPLFMSPEVIETYTREDKVVEVLGAAFFFLTGLLLAVEFRRSLARGDSVTKKASLMALSGAFFVFAMEEISWGQRIFGFDSSFFNDENLQAETNLHNMNWFAGGEATIPINLEQLFVAFLFTIGLLIPILASLSPTARRLFERNFVVFPLSIGLVLTVNYGLQKLLLRLFEWAPGLYQHPTRPPAVPIYEVREYGYALVFLAIVGYHVAFGNHERGDRRRDEPKRRIRFRRGTAPEPMGSSSD